VRPAVRAVFGQSLANRACEPTVQTGLRLLGLPGQLGCYSRPASGFSSSPLVAGRNEAVHGVTPSRGRAAPDSMVSQAAGRWAAWDGAASQATHGDGGCTKRWRRGVARLAARLDVREGEREQREGFGE
ncbi:hypothetical protein Droror1_Dr00027155, partial [Drosera rotundifolia]